MWRSIYADFPVKRVDRRVSCSNQFLVVIVRLKNYIIQQVRFKNNYKSDQTDRHSSGVEFLRI
jgi:hypothetical protein